MKRVVFGLVALALFCSQCIPVCASQLMEDLFESADLERLEEVLPQDLPLREELLAGVQTQEPLDTDAVFSNLFSQSIQGIKDALFAEFSLFASLFCVLVLSAFFSSMRQAWFRDTVGDVVDFLSVLVMAGTSYYALYTLFGVVQECLIILCNFLSAMLPIAGAVYTLSGGVVTATVQSSLFLSAIALLQALCTDYLMPLMCASFSLSAAGAVSSVNFTGLSRFLRRALACLISLVFLVLLFILGIRTWIAASADTLTLRSARFVAANFIPAVGSLFSESAKTVFSALGVLRSSVGFLGVFSVLWVILIPLICVLLRRCLFSVLGALAECFSLERESVFFSECAQTAGLLSAVVLSCGVFFILGFALFMTVSIGG